MISSSSHSENLRKYGLAVSNIKYYQLQIKMGKSGYLKGKKMSVNCLNYDFVYDRDFLEK